MNASLEELIPESMAFSNVEDAPPPTYYKVKQVI
jgi:hypothetical protein